jgi:hypothetical protein
MFNKIHTIFKFSHKVITINELVEIIKDNPQKTIIDKIRSVEYKSKEYDNLKLKLNAVTPHGIFMGLNNVDLIKVSGYLYYDIDGFNTIEELNDIKNKLINTNFISFICKSVGGRGLSFLIKVDTKLYSNDTLPFMHAYVFDILSKMGFKLDNSAKGISRKLIISSDNDVYFNEKVSLPISLVSFNAFKANLDQSIIIKINSRPQQTKGKEGIKGNDTFLTLINKGDLKIIEETQIDIKTNFKIEEIDYYKIIKPKVIKDGDKHRVYTRIINALYYLNRNITPDEVYSYIYYMNLNAENPMTDKRLRRFVSGMCDSIEKGGIRIKLRKKKIHINKDYDKKEKMIMGGRLNATLRKNESIRQIEEARQKCIEMNVSPTQKRIQQISGLSISTVKRNWNKQWIDLNEVDLEKLEIQIERDYQISQIIDEDTFFQPETEIINYKGLKMVEIEKVSPEDKKSFLVEINRLKDIFGDVSEDMVYELKLFSKEKTWYLYDKWRKKWGY